MKKTIHFLLSLYLSQNLAIGWLKSRYSWIFFLTTALIVMYKLTSPSKYLHIWVGTKCGAGVCGSWMTYPHDFAESHTIHLAPPRGSCLWSEWTVPATIGSCRELFYRHLHPLQDNNCADPLNWTISKCPILWFLTKYLQTSGSTVLCAD